MVSFVMAWSPFQRANAGIIWVEQPGDYADPIPTTPATGPALVIRHQETRRKFRCPIVRPVWLMTLPTRAVELHMFWLFPSDIYQLPVDGTAFHWKALNVPQSVDMKYCIPKLALLDVLIMPARTTSAKGSKIPLAVGRAVYLLVNV